MQRIANVFLLILIVVNVIYVILGAHLYPLASIDAISIWYLKAKAFYLFHGNLPIEILKNGIYLNTHPQYPLLIPYTFYLIFSFLGGVNENVIAFINPLFYIFILILCYKTIKEIFKSNLTIALTFTYIYSMLSPLLSQGGRMHSGDVDIFIVFSYWLVIYLSNKFLKNKSYLLFWEIVGIIMICSQIKGEGIFLSAVLLFMPVKNSIKIISVLAALIPFIIWRIFIYHYQIPNDFYFIIPSFTELPTRIFDIFYYTLLEMLKINNWYIFWPIFSILLFLDKFKTTPVNIVLNRSLSIIILLFFLFYLFVSVNPSVYVPSSIDRILIQISPLFFLVFIKQIKNRVIG